MFINNIHESSFHLITLGNINILKIGFIIFVFLFSLICIVLKSKISNFCRFLLISFGFVISTMAFGSMVYGNNEILLVILLTMVRFKLGLIIYIFQCFFLWELNEFQLKNTSNLNVRSFIKSIKISKGVLSLILVYLIVNINTWSIFLLVIFHSFGWAALENGVLSMCENEKDWQLVKYIPPRWPEKPIEISSSKVEEGDEDFTEEVDKGKGSEVENVSDCFSFLSKLYLLCESAVIDGTLNEDIDFEPKTDIELFIFRVVREVELMIKDWESNKNEGGFYVDWKYLDSQRELLKPYGIHLTHEGDFGFITPTRRYQGFLITKQCVLEGDIGDIGLETERENIKGQIKNDIKNAKQNKIISVLVLEDKKQFFDTLIKANKEEKLLREGK